MQEMPMTTAPSTPTVPLDRPLSPRPDSAAGVARDSVAVSRLMVVFLHPGGAALPAWRAGESAAPSCGELVLGAGRFGLVVLGNHNQRDREGPQHALGGGAQEEPALARQAARADDGDFAVHPVEFGDGVVDARAGGHGDLGGEAE